MRSQMSSLGLLILRVLMGLGIASHGYSLVFGGGVRGLVESTREMGFPLPAFFAWMAALSQFFGGLLIAAGLATRVASFFVFCTMGVAVFLFHAGDPFGRKELALAYCTVSLALMFTGPGPYSLDKLLRRE